MITETMSVAVPMHHATACNRVGAGRNSSRGMITEKPHMKRGLACISDPFCYVLPGDVLPSFRLFIEQDTSKNMYSSVFALIRELLAMETFSV